MMGQNIVELGSGGVIVTTMAAGRAHGFRTTTPAFAISTADRGAERDYIVLTREEGLKVAMGILADEFRRKGEVAMNLQDIAGLIGVDLDRLMEFGR